MAVKSLFLLVVVLAYVLLGCKDTAHARELITTNGLMGNVEPEIGPDGLKDKKMFLVIGVFPQTPGFGAGYGSGFQPGSGGGFGGPGYGLGFGPGIVTGGANNGFGFPGFGGPAGFGVPGF